MSQRVEMRDYQADCLAAIKSALSRPADSDPPRRQRVLVSLPTGAGKTIVLSRLISDMKRGRALVLAHRDELITQTAEKLLMVDRSLEVGIVKAQQDHYWAQVVVGSVQTLARGQRLERIGRPDVIIVDEAHHAAATSYMGILTRLGAFQPGGPIVVGVTATPDRADGVGLDDVFEEIVYELPPEVLIRLGYLVEPRAIRVHLEMDLSRVKSNAGDLVASQAGAVLMEAEAPEHVARAIKQFAADRKTLVFTPTVAVAEAVAEACNDAGLASAALSAKTPSDKRRRMLADLGSDTGRLQVVANVGVLTEGTDIPPVSCIAMARPTKSRSLYTQMVGRGLRPYPGKQDALILDFTGSTGKHRLQTAATLYGVKPSSFGDGRTLSEALEIEEREAEVAEQMEAPRDGRLIGIAARMYEGQRDHWVKNASGHFLLSMGEGLLVLHPDDSGWTVLERPARQATGEDRVLASGIALEAAQGVAEKRAEGAGASQLISPDAPWRVRPITDRQVWRLKQLKAWNEGITTQGQASDAITAAMAG